MAGKPTTWVVGLTGGIGCGKSTVGHLFGKLGIEVIEADAITRELVAPGSPALGKIVERFGPGILKNDLLDRSRLRQIIFSAPQDKDWLEDLLHPMVREKILEAVENAASSYVILDVPLLLESNDYDFVNRILVVDCPIQLQLERVMARDLVSEAEVRKILANQMTREERLARADDVIINDGDIESLRREVRGLHENYRQRSQYQTS